MRVSKNCIELIKKFEGFKSKPYLCPANVPTIGYGTTIYPGGRKVTLADKSIDEKEAEFFLEYDVKDYEIKVDAMTTDSVNQNQFDALVSFAYNCGTNALKGSTLLRKVNKRPQDPTIRNEFMKWVNAGGKKLNGLIRRREEESKLYFL